MECLPIRTNVRLAIFLGRERPAGLPKRSAVYQPRRLKHYGATITQHKLHHNLRQRSLEHLKSNNSAQPVFVEKVGQLGEEVVPDSSRIGTLTTIVLVWVKAILS